MLRFGSTWRGGTGQTYAEGLERRGPPPGDVADDTGPRRPGGRLRSRAQDPTVPTPTTSDRRPAGYAPGVTRRGSPPGLESFRRQPQPGGTRPPAPTGTRRA